ncbi:helix-turn-helix domain-containing protein [Actinomadura sp. PM05-2]|uniref:Helix-turn-helix domain-containing protein n=2 Tax=Actinomadura parmotrematis TaxID=2864039 RepID=A0ABS7G1T6_9ACTN|nr:helix-turn-helix domain-containing protein [Actinomadura parmotrematis]
MTQQQAAAELDWHHTKIFRIESGRTGPHPNDVRRMLEVYGLHDEADREALLSLAKEARQRGWWYSYRDVLPSQYEFYIGMESQATSIDVFELAVVHGLLQTEDYARALIRSGPLELDPQEIERRVEVRTTRQEILARPDRPQLWAIMDEAAIRRPVGGATTMVAQLKHLLEVAHGKTTVQVIPYSAGAHPGTTGPFTVLAFEGAEGDMVYMETINGNLWVDKADEVRRFTTAFDHLRAVALSPDDTRAMLNAALNDLKRS